MSLETLFDEHDKELYTASLVIVGAVVIAGLFLLFIDWLLSEVNEVEKSFLKAFAWSELSLIGIAILFQLGTMLSLKFLTGTDVTSYWLILFGYYPLTALISPGFYPVAKAVQESEDLDLLNYNKIKKVILTSVLVFTLWTLLFLTGLFGNVQFLWNKWYAFSYANVVYVLDEQGQFKLAKMEKGHGLLADGLQKKLGEEQFLFAMLTVWLIEKTVEFRAFVYVASWLGEG